MIFLSIQLPISIIHGIHDFIPVEQNNQLLRDKIDCFIFHRLRYPDGSVFGHSDFSFHYGNICAVQLFRIIQIIGIERSTGNIRQYRSNAHGVRISPAYDRIHIFPFTQYNCRTTDLMRAEAEALLAGIVLDTKNFSMRTGGRTFEAAAFLRRAGADTAEVKRLFQNDLEGTIAKYSIIQNAKMYREGIAVAVVDHTVGRITAAQAADELLNIIGIDTSFVLYPDGDRVIVSARSIGEVNVQVILEKLGGGGNAAAAGGQIPDKSLTQVAQELAQAIDQYLEDE